jgi:hypothetical protein
MTTIEYIDTVLSGQLALFSFGPVQQPASAMVAPSGETVPADLVAAGQMLLFP